MLSLIPNALSLRKTSDVLQLSKSKIFGDKSYADDLNMERGTVKSRVAFVLRSSEIKHLFYRFVTLWQVIFFKKLFRSLCIHCIPYI